MNDIKLTTKQTEILLLLYKFRFLHTFQIQHLLKHKNANRIKAWLKELTEKEYIKRDYTQHTMIKKPAIYSLTLKARDLLKKRKECEIAVLNKIYREKSRSKTFVDHCILIADIYLTIQAQRSEIIYFATKNNLTNYDYFPTPLPDAYIAFKKPQKTQRYFLEVIDDNLPRFALRSKIQRYIDYYQSDLWEEHTEKSFPKIMIVCNLNTCKQYLTRFINKTVIESGVEMEFFITTPPDTWRKEGFKINMI